MHLIFWATVRLAQNSLLTCFKLGSSLICEPLSFPIPLNRTGRTVWLDADHVSVWIFVQRTRSTFDLIQIIGRVCRSVVGELQFGKRTIGDEYWE